MPRKWTEQEDAVLKAQVQDFCASGLAVDWNGVSRNLSGRTNKDCRKRWQKIDTRWHRGAWTASEDARLRDAVHQHGERWAAASALVQTRSPDQCSKRWRNKLNPTLCHEAWGEEADKLLIRTVQSLGRDWKSISELYFPDRSTQDLNNRHALLKRRHLAHENRDKQATTPTTPRQASESEIFLHDVWPQDDGQTSTESVSWSSQNYGIADDLPADTCFQQLSESSNSDDVTMPWGNEFDLVQGDEMSCLTAGAERTDGTTQSTVNSTAPMDIVNTSEGRLHPRSMSNNSDNVLLPWPDDLNFTDDNFYGLDDGTRTDTTCAPNTGSQVQPGLACRAPASKPDLSNSTSLKKTLIIENLEPHARAAIVNSVLNYGGTITMKTTPAST